MIPSFHPVHRRRAALAGTQASALVDPETGLEQLTLSQILAEASSYRFVDGCHINYPGLLSVELGKPDRSPLTATSGPIAWPSGAPRVVVVGGGLGGLLTAWQLRKAGMQVSLLEAADSPDATDGVAGRIRTVQVRPGDTSTSAELGAMRFPTTSYLFWHYLACCGAATANELFTAFPNVGNIPSAFTGTGISSVWGNGALSLPPDYAALNDRHLAAFTNYAPPGGPNGATIGSIATLLNKPPVGDDLTTIDKFWTSCIAALYGISYRSFLEGLGFTEEEITRIGYMGIGTGGFEPLFGVDVLDIMRLFLWGYSNEMGVPRLKDLPKKLFAQLQLSGVGSIHRAAAVTVLYSPAQQRYSVGYQLAGQSGTLYTPAADYVVLAMTHVAAQRLLSRSLLYLVGNGFASDAIVPFYDPRYPFYGSRIRPELNNQLAMQAVKIFHTIAGPARQSSDASLSPWVRAVPRSSSSYDTRLRSCYGNFAPGAVPLGVSYMLPRTGVALGSSSYLLGLHYAWGADADEVNEKLLKTTPLVALSVALTGVYQGSNTDPYQLSGRLADALRQRFNGFTPDASLNGSLETGLTRYFEPYRRASIYPEEGSFAVVYWPRVPYVWGGFKLDKPGVGAYLGFAYKLVTNATANPKLGAWDRNTGTPAQPLYEVHPAIKGLYFAGDSFSNYGGWAEGAFQSAIATAAGIVKSAAVKAFGPNYGSQVNLAAITALVDQARDPSSYARSR